MAKLPTVAASRIWRTVVVAGAMLGAPAIAIADTPPAKNAPAKNPCAGDTKKDEPKKDDTAKKDDKKPDTTKKDDPKKTDTAKKRPRSDGGDRPTGRGFILS